MKNCRTIGALIVLFLIISKVHSAPVTMAPNPITGLTQGAYHYELDLLSADSNSNTFTFSLNLVQASTTGQYVNFDFAFDEAILSSSVVDQGGYPTFQFSNVNTLSVGLLQETTAGTSGTIEFTFSATPTTLDVTPFFGTVKSATFTTVPIPNAIWLFFSGLMGVIGVARLKRAF